MPKDKFAIGIDYGTESGRVVVIRVRDGDEVANAIIPYPDGVIDEKLPGGRPLEPDWALQNPHDYRQDLPPRTSPRRAEGSAA